MAGSGPDQAPRRTRVARGSLSGRAQLGCGVRKPQAIAWRAVVGFAFVRLSKEAFEWHKNEKTSHRLMAS